MKFKELKKENTELKDMIRSLLPHKQLELNQKENQIASLSPMNEILTLISQS